MESPAQTIERLKDDLRSQSDADVLRELELLPVLPELGVLRDRRGFAALLRALSDSAGEVRRTACLSFSMLTRDHPDTRTEIIAALTPFRDAATDTKDQKDADEAIQRIVAG